MRLLAVCALANAFVAPWNDAFRPPRVVVHSTPGGPLGPGGFGPGGRGPGGADPLGDGDGLWRPDDMAYLQARMEKIRAAEGPFGERRDEATMLYEMMTERHPSEMIRAFALGAGPEVRMAVQETVTGLLGSLPAWMMEGEFTATGATLASMCLQLQLTGYVLRNAEYVLALRSMLDIRARSSSEYRAAFERADKDGSGYLETSEVEALLREVVYDGAAPPSFEVRSFLDFFDANRDGRISWREFAAALGLREAAAAAADAPAARALEPAGGEPDDDDEPPPPSPKVSGTVSLTLDDGSEIEVGDAAARRAPAPRPLRFSDS